MRLVYLALGWATGIVLAANTQFHLPLLWLALAIIALLITWRVRRIEAAVLLLFALGGLRMASTPTTSGIAAYNELGGMTIEGVVVGEPDRREDRVQLRLSVETVTRAGATTPADGLVLVDAPPLTDVSYGDRIAATGLLLEPGEGDRFSYADYLARSGVYSLMRETSVEVIQRAGVSFFGTLFDLKARANAAINAALPEPQAGLLAGILLGNERGIAPEVSDAFAATGAAHVIAISGFNMAIISGVVIGTLRRLRVPRIPAVVISILVIGIYTLFVGANPAVVRAALMSSLLIVGRALRRQTYLPASLAFAALVLSLDNPLVLWDVSFQLSFFATLGLALFAEPLSARFDALLTRWFSPSAARWLGVLLNEPVIVTIAALVFTLPLTMLYFGRVSPVVLLINLLIVPAQTALLLLGGAATLVAFVSPLIAQILYWFDLIPLAWTIGVVRLFTRLPTFEVFVAANAIAAFFVVILGIAMVRATQPRWSINLMEWVQRRAVIAATLFSGVSILILIAALLISRPDGLLHLWLLDMEGSNAILIQTPRGAHFLIDGGRYPARLLTALGDRLPFTSRSIEILFLTQPDEFQFGALPPVLDRYTVGVTLSNGQPNLNDAYAALMARLDTVVNVYEGYTLDTDEGLHIEILNPTREPALADSLDENVLVLRLRYGDMSFLLASELSSEGQTALIESGQNLKSSVLQIPPELEAEFVEAVQPRVGVLQVGMFNEDDLLALDAVPIYRTDKSGTIHLSTNGHELWVG